MESKGWIGRSSGGVSEGKLVEGECGTLLISASFVEAEWLNDGLLVTTSKAIVLNKCQFVETGILLQWILKNLSTIAVIFSDVLVVVRKAVLYVNVQK